MTPFLTAILLAMTTATEPQSGVPIEGYQEVVLSVSDRQEYQRFFEEVAGWNVQYDGPISREQLQFQGLETSWTGHETVLVNAHQPRGWVRLMQFEGGDQVQIRSSAQAWDTGGWFDFNVRVANMDAKFQHMQSLGWQSSTDPVQFDFGPFEVKEWLARGPDGIVIALIERIRPPLEGWDDLKHFSRAFNATQIVSDFTTARAFYTETLGFQPYLDHSGPSRAAGPNVLGLPHNLTAEIPRHITILHPEATNEGSIELLQFDGATGRDFSDRAQAPNLGVLTLRFPTEDADALARQVVDRGGQLIGEAVTLELPPYGRVRMIAVEGPDGARLEFYSSKD